MLDWFKKEDSISESTGERTNNTSDGNPEEMLAVIFNKKIRRGITKVPATIGKNPNAADVSFFHNSVDNIHCTVDCKNRQFTITDNGSREGTYVNGEKLEAEVPYNVDDGDSIVIGKGKFELSINYPELAKREKAAALAAKASEKPEEKTYTIQARPVAPIEYDEAEVVYVSCGLEPVKKKAKYTQEINAEQIREAVKSAEEKRAEEMSMTGAGPGMFSSFRSSAYEPSAPEPTPAKEEPPVFVPEPAGDDPEPEKTEPIPVSSAEQEPAPALSLTCISGMGVGEVILIDHFPFTMGRSKSNDYTLKIDKVSRHHACLTEKGGMYYITDTNSTNGIRVNGIRIDRDVEYRISIGDTIKMSDNVYSVGFPGQ